MFNFDAGKMAKNAVQQGLRKAEELAADLPVKAPEQLVSALRKLLDEARAKFPAGKNEALDACVQKAQTLLEGGDAPAEAVARLTAELGTLLRGAPAGTPGKEKDDGGVRKTAGAGMPGGAAGKAAKTAAAPVAAPAAPKRAAEPPETVQFSDVAAGAYYYDAVQWAVRQGIASGTSETTFSPDQDCTRAQTLTLLWRAAGSPAPGKQDNPFTDVKETAYYRDAALWAAERGIVSGPALEPDGAVTRAQMAAFLYRDAGSPAVRSGNDFSDVPEDAYYCQAVAWVAAQGITSGTGEHTFSPDTVCTRGQIVTFLYRARK